MVKVISLLFTWFVYNIVGSGSGSQAGSIEKLVKHCTVCEASSRKRLGRYITGGNHKERHSEGKHLLMRTLVLTVVVTML